MKDGYELRGQFKGFQHTIMIKELASGKEQSALFVGLSTLFGVV